MISLDATRKRIEFRSQDNSTIGFSTRTKKLSLTRNLTTCWTYDVYVKKNILDFSSLISVDMNYSLSSNHTATPMSSMQDPALSNRTSSTAKFNTTCGGDNFCSYDLTIDAAIKLPVHSSSGVVLMNASDLLIIDETTDTQPIVISVNISNI
uniref:Integrin alpha first immunoglubulin-like domain-containing protein n=1 Tax=Ciona savignyi TaxID=51511 RepID=H2Z3K5_CIOSA